MVCFVLGVRKGKEYVITLLLFNLLTGQERNLLTFMTPKNHYWMPTKTSFFISTKCMKSALLNKLTVVKA